MSNPLQSQFNQAQPMGEEDKNGEEEEEPTDFGLIDANTY